MTSRFASSPILESPQGAPFDSTTESDASDTGVGEVTFVEAASAAASAFVAALVAAALVAAVVRRARQGFQFMAALPHHLLVASSTLRELYGVDLVISAMAHLLWGRRHKVVMDNLGCVLIIGGGVPSFATGGWEWGEFVSGVAARDRELRVERARSDTLTAKHVTVSNELKRVQVGLGRGSRWRRHASSYGNTNPAVRGTCVY